MEVDSEKFSQIDPNFVERRRLHRQPGNRRAGIIHVKGQPPIMCTLGDISEVGAGLIVGNSQDIPDFLDLEIKGEEIKRHCRVAWRGDAHRLGVAFL